jgi:hypothetical protein
MGIRPIKVGMAVAVCQNFPVLAEINPTFTIMTATTALAIKPGAKKPKPRRRRKAGEARKKPYSAASLNNEAWIAWLETYLTTDADEQGSRRFNGKRVLGSDARALHRWLYEDAAPSIWAADSWAIRYGLHVNSYFTFCGSKSYEPWQQGSPPSFETEALTVADWEEIQRAWPLRADLEDWPARSVAEHNQAA